MIGVCDGLFIYMCVCVCVESRGSRDTEPQPPPLLLWRQLDSFLVMVSGLTTYSAVCMYTRHVLYNRVHSAP